jgi:hypothetical protein
VCIDFSNIQVNTDNDATTFIDYSINKSQYVREQDLINVYNTNKGIVKKGDINSTKQASSKDDSININGTTCRCVNFVSVSYSVHNNTTSDARGFSLVDWGANGGLLGSDICVIHQTNCCVTITGIDNHQVGDLPIGTGAGYGMTDKGPVIFIMHQYDCLQHRKTIHASGQLE